MVDEPSAAGTLPPPVLPLRLRHHRFHVRLEWSPPLWGIKSPVLLQLHRFELVGTGLLFPHQRHPHLAICLHRQDLASQVASRMVIRPQHLLLDCGDLPVPGDDYVLGRSVSPALVPQHVLCMVERKAAFCSSSYVIRRANLASDITARAKLPLRPLRDRRSSHQRATFRPRLLPHLNFNAISRPGRGHPRRSGLLSLSHTRPQSRL